MPLYTYYKALPRVAPGEVGTATKNPLKRLLAPVMITLGSLLVANVAWPIVSYQLFTAPTISRTEFIAPIPSEDIGVYTAPPQSAYTAYSYAPQVLGAADLDYTKPQNWFPDAPYDQTQGQTTTYTIAIPAVSIEDANVLYGGAELNDHLIQYPGTALPGQPGSPVIFGHSILRQFYNPSINNPNRYTSMFSKIMTLKNGDKIYLEYDGIRYTYEVTGKAEVKPTDVFILEQRYNNRELKLITCVPEGTYLRRGVVVAQLVDTN